MSGNDHGDHQCQDHGHSHAAPNINLEHGDDQIYKKISAIIKNLEAKGLTIKDAGFSATKSRVEYVRGKDFSKMLTDNLSAVVTEFNAVKDYNLDPNGSNTINKIFQILRENGMVIQAAKYEEDVRKKYPKRLLPSRTQSATLEEDSIYILDIYRSKFNTYLYLILAVIGVLALVMISVWPLWLQLGVWWVSFILLCAILGLIAVRYAIFIFFYSAGIDVWLFPNLFDDRLGFLDSFKPIIQVKKREDMGLWVAVRFVIAALLICTGIYLYMNPELVYDFIDHVKEIGEDIFEWGNYKIINLHNQTQISIVNKADEYVRRIEDELYAR